MGHIFQKQKLLEAAKLFNEYHLLRRALQVVVAVSVLCVLFFCYSPSVAFFLHSSSVYFSTYLFSIFTHSLESKYMFLIFNGILAFLTKSSVSRVNDDVELSTTKAAVVAQDQVLLPVDQDIWSSVLDGVVSVDEEETSAEDDGSIVVEERLRNEVYVDNEEKSHQAFSSSTSAENEIEQEEELKETTIAAGDEELISTDELNKKFEEFIRRMREEIRIEAQQQLITV